MKKILFLITTLGNGGAEKVLVDMVNNLDKSKFEITVQTIINTGERRYELSQNVKYKSVVSTKSKFIKKIAVNLIYKILPAKWVYNLFVKGNYDIEVAFLEGFPTKIIANSTNKNSKKIAWVHTDLVNFFDSANDFVSFEENKKAYEKFNSIVGVSQGVVDKFTERFNWEKDNTYVLYNVNEQREILQKAKQNVNIKSNNKIHIVACGSLLKQKGFDRLLRVHSQLLKDGLMHDLWIVGEGEERKNLEKYIKENKLTDTVTLFGFQKNPYSIIAKADLFVCSSVAEGYSTVVTEAYILGVPIITVNVSGMNEPKECPRYSVLCENDEHSLYLAIREVLQNPEKIEQFKNNMKLNTKYFTAKYQIQQIEEFLLGINKLRESSEKK